MRRGEWIDPALSSVTVEELSERWFAGLHSLKPKTVESYSSLLRSRVLPAFGDWQVQRVKRFDVEAWVAGMVGEGLSPSRTIQSKLVLQLIYDVGVRDGYVARNPVVGVRLPRLQHREAAFFEPQVVDSLVAALAAPYGPLVAIMGVCGLRWGEAVALRRRHVDALRRRLIVEESLAEISGHFIFGTTKSHARRNVPVSPRVLAMLEEALADKGRGLHRTHPRDDLVFTGPKGGPLRYRYFLMKVWHPALKAMGLPVVGVHVLRHSAAARIVSAGGSHKTLQTVLGHKSAAFSLTVYAHLFDADLDALADRLDAPSERKAQ